MLNNGTNSTLLLPMFGASDCKYCESVMATLVKALQAKGSLFFEKCVVDVPLKHGFKTIGNRSTNIVSISNNGRRSVGDSVFRILQFYRCNRVQIHWRQKKDLELTNLWHQRLW